MNISNNRPQIATRNSRLPRREAAPTSDQVTLSEDLYDFKTNATMVGFMSVAGGALGSIPGVGAWSSAQAAGHGAGTFTKSVALTATLANVVTTGLVLTGSTSAWSMAVPGVLGAVAAGSYAYETRNHV